MGHRHLFSTSRTFEADHDQNRSHIHDEHSYVDLGRAGAAHNGSFAFRPQNVQTEGVNFPFNWNSALRSNIGMEVPYGRVPMPGSSYNPIWQPSAARSFLPVTESYTGSSFSHYRHVVPGVEEGITNSTVGNARGLYKRKRPAVTMINERGSTRQNSNAESFYDFSTSSNLQMGRDAAFEHWPREFVRMTPSNEASTLSIPFESFQRNVRSRSTLDLDVNQARAFISSGVSHQLPSIGSLMYHPGTVLGARATTQEHNRIPMSSVTRQRSLVSDPSGLRRDTIQSSVVSSRITGRVDIDRYHTDHISRRYPVTAQNLLSPITQAARGSHNSATQGVVPAYRSMHHYQYPGQVAAFLENAMQSGSYSSSYSRPVPMIGWHNTDRSGRSRIPYQRLPLLPSVADVNGRLVAEDFMTVDALALYNSRNFLDQHRDMRLEIDDMSYEELLDLGERIGKVSTGVSEGSMSECLSETAYYTSNQMEEKDSCAICLEEYENEDIVAMLINCGHSYHTGCVKKWLSTKNACPICKAPAQKADG